MSIRSPASGTDVPVISSVRARPVPVVRAGAGAVVPEARGRAPASRRRPVDFVLGQLRIVPDSKTCSSAASSSSCGVDEPIGAEVDRLTEVEPELVFPARLTRSTRSSPPREFERVARTSRPRS